MNWKVVLHSAIVTGLSVLVGAIEQYFHTGGAIPQTGAQWQAFLGSVAATALLAVAALLKQSPLNASPGGASSASGNVTKISVLLALALILLAPVQMRAQSASAATAPAPAPTGLQNLYAAGVSYNPGGSPGIAGTALYGRCTTSTPALRCPTYAFTAVDAVTTSVKPFTVSTNVGVGLAQQIATLGKAAIYMPTAAGISWNGGNTGWQWNGGALISIPVKKVMVMPTVRFLKSSVSNGSGYQIMGTLLIGWGQ
jgi:hypothetical protein